RSRESALERKAAQSELPPPRSSAASRCLGINCLSTKVRQVSAYPQIEPRRSHHAHLSNTSAAGSIRAAPYQIEEEESRCPFSRNSVPPYRRSSSWGRLRWQLLPAVQSQPAGT